MFHYKQVSVVIENENGLYIDKLYEPYGKFHFSLFQCICRALGLVFIPKGQIPKLFCFNYLLKNIEKWNNHLGFI